MRFSRHFIFLVIFFLAVGSAYGQQISIGVSPAGKCVASTPGKIFIVGLDVIIFFPPYFDVQLEDGEGVLEFCPGSKNLKSARYGKTYIILKAPEDRIGLSLEVEVIKEQKGVK